MSAGKLVVKEDRTLVYEPWAGTHISSVAEEVCATAGDLKAPVSFTFNGVDMTVQPGSTASDVMAEWDRILTRQAEEYRASPEYKRRQEERQRRVAQSQAKASALVRRLPDVAHDLDLMVHWLADASRCMDDMDVGVDYPAIVAVLEKHWQENAHVGVEPHNFTKKMLGEWVVGQAIDSMKRGLPPHQLTQKFATDLSVLHRG